MHKHNFFKENNHPVNVIQYWYFSSVSLVFSDALHHPIATLFYIQEKALHTLNVWYKFGMIAKYSSIAITKWRSHSTCFKQSGNFNNGRRIPKMMFSCFQKSCFMDWFYLFVIFIHLRSHIHKF